MNARPPVTLTAVVLLTLMLVSGCGKSPKVGPRLLPVAETINLVKSQAKLITIDRVEMQTSGPIYRVVFGKDSNGRRKAVWVSDHIVFQVDLDKGISREEAIKIAKEKGFNNSAVIQLVYAPAAIWTKAPNSSSDIFWWIRNPGAEPTHILFLKFSNGVIEYEWKQ